MVTLRDEKWVEQAWIITPLPDGGMEMKGSSHEARRTDSTTQSCNTAETKAATHSHHQKAENTDRTAKEERWNAILQTFSIWLAGAMVLAGMGYILAKHQNKKTT